MRRQTAFVSAIFCLALTTSTAQAAEELRGIPGVLLSNGAFRPLPPPSTNAPAATTTARGGVITVTATVQIVSNAANLTPSTIKCKLTASVFDTDGVNINQIEEVDSKPATVSGTTARCAMTIPYYWRLYNPAADMVNFNLAVTGFDANGKGRASSVTIPPIAIPASGVTTLLSFTARL